MDKESYRRAAASYNHEAYKYSSDENFGTWPHIGRNYDDREEIKGDINTQRKYISSHSKPPMNAHTKMAQKGQHPAPFHSALNPLEYYHDQEEEDQYSNNELRRFAEKHHKRTEEEEELKYEDHHYNGDGNSYSEEEINPDDKLSEASYDEENIGNGRDSNRDKPRSFTNSIPNNNSREFRSNHGTEVSKSTKREKDGNMTLELSPEAV